MRNFLLKSIILPSVLFSEEIHALGDVVVSNFPEEPPPPLQPPLTVLFVGILVATIIRSAVKYFNLPTPFGAFMLTIGMLWGVVCYFEHEVGRFTHLLFLYPSDLIYLYLPVLIFKTAFCIETHILLKPLSQILLISVAVYLVSSAFVGILMKFIMDSGWTYVEGLYFGNLCNPIYSIEVVRLLKEIGVHTKQTSILLEGEAILGVSCVWIITKIYLGNLNGFLVRWYHFFIVLIRLVSLGMLVGYLLGYLGALLMRKMSNDVISVIVITFSVPFITFVIVEHFLGGSGVLAVMLIGIVMSLERSSLSPDMDNMVCDFWKTFSHLMNTYIYLIGGTMAAWYLLPVVDWKDCILLFVTYLWTNIGRFLAFLLFAPILSRIGYGMTFRNMQLCVWGGLKSPVCVFCGIIFFELAMPKEKMSAEVLLHLVALCLFSLIVNGTFTPLLLKVIGLSQISMVKQVNMNNCVKYVLARRTRAIATLKMDRFLSDTNWPLVHATTTLKHPYQIKLDEHDEDAEGDFFMGYRFTYCPECKKEVFSEPTPKELREMTREARMRVLKAKKTSYSRQFENGMISKECTRILNQAVEIAMDTEEAVIELDGLYKRFKEEGCCNRCIRNRLHNFVQNTESRLRPPRKYWRRVSFHIVQSIYFTIFMYLMVLLNLIPIIMDYACHPLTPYMHLKCSRLTYGMMALADTFFCFIFYMECIMKILANSFIYFWRHGVRTYFKSVWNIFDFVVLIAATGDLVIDYMDLAVQGPTIRMTRFTIWQIIITVKLMRVLRFLKILLICKRTYIKMLRYWDSRVDLSMGFAYEIGKGYATGEEEILEMLPHMIDNEKIREAMRQKIEMDRLAITKLLGIVQKERPWIAITVKTKQAIRTILNSMRDAINELKVSGWVDDVEYAKLMKSLLQLYKYVAAIKAVQPSAPRVIFKEVTWMAGEEEIIDYLFDNVMTKKFDPGEVICEEGKVAAGIYIVVTGLLMLLYTPSDTVLTDLVECGRLPIVDYIPPTKYREALVDYIVSGNCVGELSTLTGRPYNCKVVADTHTQVYLLHRDVIQKAMDMSPDPINGLECRIWRAVSIRIAIAILMDVPAYQTLTQDKIKFALERAFMPILTNYKIFVVTTMMEDILLIEGVAIDLNTRDAYTGPCYIPRNVQKLILPRSSLITVPEGLETKLLIIPEKDVDEYEIMVNEEEVCEMVASGSSRCLLHLIQNRNAKMQLRNKGRATVRMFKERKMQNKSSMSVSEGGLSQGTILTRESVSEEPPMLQESHHSDRRLSKKH